MKLAWILVLGAVLAAIVAPAAMSEQSSRPTLTAGSSTYGKALLDGRGYVLYAFTRDQGGAPVTARAPRPGRRTTPIGVLSASAPG